MGRSGGGGGSHSSGGFSGGHSSGGFSGGGRSSGGGFSSRPSFGGGGGFHGYNPPPRGPRPMYHHHIWFGRPYYREPYYRGGTGCSFVVTFIFMLAIIIIIVSASMTSNNGGVPSNTKQRTALSGVVNKTDWYEDKIGWISNKNTLISGLEDFYNKTGVQPYVMLIPYSAEYWNGSSLNVNSATNYLESVYKNKFSDEGHFIFAYFECQNDTKSEMDGEFRYLAGYSVDTIMDNEALNIFNGYLQKNYYNTSLSLEEMISKTFSETAKNIMSKPTNGWDFGKTLLIVIAVVAVIFIIYMIIKNQNKREKEKEEHTEKILNTPLEKFGTDTSDLENKYKDDK